MHSCFDWQEITWIWASEERVGVAARAIQGALRRYGQDISATQINPVSEPFSITALLPQAPTREMDF